MLIIKKTFRWIIYAILLMLALMAIAAAIITFVIFPNIDRYKDDISALISEKVSLKTSIGNIATGWDGLSPKIRISEIDLYDKDNTSALHLENVKGTFSWLSVPLMHPHLSNISISNPKLTVHRKANGSIFVAGIPLAGEGKPDLANWLLSQAQISVNNATVIWQDDFRQAPQLSLNKVYLKVSNPAWRKIFGQHLFTISAQPSAGAKQPIQANGHFFGRDISKIENWRGEVTLETQEIDLTAWKEWLDYPIDLQSGAGNTNLALTFSNKQLDKVKADIVLHDMSIKLKENSQFFNAELLSGLITWEKTEKATTITAKNIKLKTENELDIDGGSGFVSHSIKNKKPWVNASLKLDSLNFGFVEKLQKAITLPKNISKPLNALAPQGQLHNLILSLEGNPKEPAHYRLASTFNSLSINAYNHIPGFKNLSGEIDTNEDNGTLELTSTNASLDFEEVLRWPIPVKELTGKLTWNKNKDRLKIIANDIIVSNDHISGVINSSYDMNGIKGGYLDLSAKFDNGNAKYAPFYYPLVMGKDTIDWLDSSILSGKANDVQLTVKGNLEDFPYVDKSNKPNPKLGVFRVTARINDAVLEYGKSWPKIEGLGLNMLFEGNSMELNADKGKIYDINIVKSKVTIPQLNTYGANAQVLNIVSEGKGPVADGIKFINTSPVKTVTLGFTDNLKASGNGKLDLNLSIPLNNLDSSKYKGEYTVTDGTMLTNESIGLPEITDIDAKINFNETGINAQKINAQILGGPLQLSLTSEPDKTIRIDAQGTLTDAGIKRVISNTFTKSLSGTANWTADIAIKKPLMNLDVQSDLKGLAINLPAPIGKIAEQEANLTIRKKQTLAAQDTFEMQFNDTVSAIILRNEKNGELTIDRGDIAINTPAIPPTEVGLVLRGKFDYINADKWLALAKEPTIPSEKALAKPSKLSLSKADISIQKFDFFNRSLNALNVSAKPSNNNLFLTLSSQELDGDVEWRSPTSKNDTGRVIAKLKRLHIPVSNKEETALADKANQDVRKLDKKYPALEVKVDDFMLGAKKLGVLELNAFADDEDWVIEQLKISNPDNTLTAEGRWHNWSRSPNTNLKFSLTANELGNTLNRFGYPDSIKGGVALISGQLQWPGSPHEFKKTGLNGQFRLGASKGQILKVKPGVGRLLGLLTLQSLPRRLTLDFRDLFSEGFAFDEISGTAKINNGVMLSDDFFMTGPAAETEIKGEINLNAETQNLNVKVVPHISDSLSLAALAGGPIAGAAAFVAQKLLKDPLNKIAQSNYTITGTWDNPVEAETKTKKEKKEPVNSPLNAQQN